MPEQQIQIKMTSEKEAGVYADFVKLWHTKDVFVFDFVTYTDIAHVKDDIVVMPATVVSRVRVPPSQVFEMMQALGTQLTFWENETGNHRAV